jgi:hypothetical protein
MGDGEVNAILTAGRAAKPSARAFVDFLIAELRDISEWRRGPPSTTATAVAATRRRPKKR